MSDKNHLPQSQQPPLVDDLGRPAGSHGNHAQCLSILGKRRVARTASLPSRPLRNRVLRRRWASRHTFCQICGIDHRAARWEQITGLQTHHIVKAGRSDEPCNLLRLCERCHRIVEGERVPDGAGGYYPKLTLAHVLYCKRAQDPCEYDPDRLTVLWRQRQQSSVYDPLPRPRPLPAVFAAERQRWVAAAGTW